MTTEDLKYEYEFTRDSNEVSFEQWKLDHEWVEVGGGQWYTKDEIPNFPSAIINILMMEVLLEQYMKSIYGKDKVVKAVKDGVFVVDESNKTAALIDWSDIPSKYNTMN